jgi:hypothetical protein
MKINRVFAIPSKDTFTIKPIRNLIGKYVKDGAGWVDPFAGNNSPAEFTNDLNPDTNVKSHLHAVEFCRQLKGTYKGVLFDPPYSLTQVKECYSNFGLQLFLDDAQKFPANVKSHISKKIEVGGYAISFGWNSSGFGKRRGFYIVEILLINHGRKHNDTIVVVEQKISGSLFEDFN